MTGNALEEGRLSRSARSPGREEVGVSLDPTPLPLSLKEPSGITDSCPHHSGNWPPEPGPAPGLRLTGLSLKFRRFQPYPRSCSQLSTLA